MQQYWKIKELNEIGYRNELRISDESKYGFDHTPVHGGNMYDYRFSELMKSPYFRWLLLFNSKSRFDLDEINSLSEFRNMYAPFILEDKYLVSELSQCFNYVRWYEERWELSDDDKEALRLLKDLPVHFHDFHVSGQERVFRDLLSILMNGSSDFFDRLSELVKRDNNSSSNDDLEFLHEDAIDQGVQYQVYIIKQLKLLLGDLISRSSKDQVIEMQYLTSDFMDKVNGLIDHLDKFVKQSLLVPNQSVTEIDYTFLKFAIKLMQENGSISNRYYELTGNNDINWDKLYSQYKDACTDSWGWISYAGIHEYANEDPLNYESRFLVRDTRNANRQGLFGSKEGTKSLSENDIRLDSSLDAGDDDFNESDLPNVDALDSDDEEASPDDDFDAGHFSSYGDDSYGSDSWVPSFSLLSHSESPTTLEDAFPMSAESSSVSDDDLLVSDSVTSTDVSEDDLSDLLVSSDSSDSQSDSQSEVSSSHSYKFHPRADSDS